LPAAMQTLAKAGELSLKLPKDITSDKFGHSAKKSLRTRVPRSASEAPPVDRAPSRALSIVARNDPASGAFVEKFMQKCCKIDASEEWRQIDDRKLDKLRGILAALKEENQDTQLLKRESEDRQAGQALQATRSNVERREKACEEQERHFERREAELRDQVEKNKNVLLLMETNIEKGDRKTKEEAAECRRLDAEIRAVEKDMQEYEESRTCEEAKIQRAAEHKAFLERVVQECEEDFEGDIKVLINRYHTLDGEKTSLHQRNKDLETELNIIREESLKEQTETQTEQMLSSSRLHESQVLLERLRVENKELEERLNRLIAEKEERKSQVGVTNMAIEQIFTRIVESCKLKQRKEAMLAEVENKDKKFVPVRGGARADPRLDAMLNQIIARVRDLRAMSEEIRENLQRHRKIEKVDVYDEVDIMSKVQVIPGRSGDLLDIPEAASSRQNSELGYSGAGVAGDGLGAGGSKSSRR